LEIVSYGKSTTGRRHKNEDSFFVKAFKHPKGCLKAIAAVSDGMGGQMGGRTASRLAKEEISKFLQSPPLKNDTVKGWIIKAVDSIQNRLVSYGADRPELSGMGTTLAMVVTSDVSVWVAHVGDSRAYKINTKIVKQLTIDHSAIQEAIDRKLYTIEDVQKNKALRNMASALLHNLGEGGDPKVDIAEFPLISGEVFLVCTDGLTGSLASTLVTKEEIKKQICGTKDIETAVNNLISIAYQKGSTDNITAIILETDTLKRSDVLVAIEPEVEVLLNKDIHQREKIERSREQTKSYRRMLPVLVSLLLLLCIAIFYFQWNPTEKLGSDLDKLEISEVTNKSKFPEQDRQSAPNNHLQPAVEWSNYDAGTLDDYRLDDLITFSIRGFGAEPIKIILTGRQTDSNKSENFEEDITNLRKENSCSFRPQDINIKAGRWDLQVILKTSKGEFKSKTMRVKIVGKVD